MGHITFCFLSAIPGEVTMNISTVWTHLSNRHQIVCFAVFVFATTLGIPAALFAEKDKPDQAQRPRHLEIPDDAYIPVDRNSQPTSPAYQFSNAGFSMVQVNVNANGLNIVGDAANEPSIAMDPTNPNNIVIGWRQFNTIASNFRQAGHGYTVDGGLTWTFPGVIEPGIFRSDPVLGSDANGNIYYNSLTNSPAFLCEVFKSTNTGMAWDVGTPAHGGDKQWMTIDKTASVGEGNIYAYWTSSFSSCLPGFFTRSVDDGASFQNCITVPSDPFWGTLAVGPDGELYVCGGEFVVAKSSTARNDGQAVTWDFSTGVSLDGDMSSFGGGTPNPGGLLGQAWIAVDHSSGTTRGNVYLLCSVNRFSNSDPLDVMFARSTDGGVTWSAPVRINDDVSTTAYQWFGTMSVAPNGRIDVIWLDTRDNPGSLNSSLYYSFSTDAGVSWSANERLSESFDPLIGWPQQNKIGDYFDMVSDESAAHLAWAGTFNGEQDVYYSTITPESLPTIPCSDISRFISRCRPGGIVQAKVVLTNTTHTGEVVMFSIDAVPYPATFAANGRAQIAPSGFGLGSHSVELIDPAGCYPAITVNCATNLAKSEEDLWEDEGSVSSAATTSLFENYPDPFNPSTTIRYLLGENAHVSLKVYNVLGQLVTILVDDQQSAGYHEAVWEGKNEAGATVASGVYVYRLASGSFSEARRMFFTK